MIKIIVFIVFFITILFLYCALKLSQISDEQDSNKKDS